MTTATTASNERATVTAAVRGDRDAMARLWRANRRWIAAVILAHKPRTVDVDDLLQEVAMTMVTKIDTLRDSNNVRAWMRAVAVNTARAAGRSQKAQPTHHLTNGLSNGLMETVDESNELSEQANRVLAQVEQLPESYREPLLLKAVRGLRSKQIAEILGINEATVDTRVSRARRMLREQSHGEVKTFDPEVVTCASSRDGLHGRRVNHEYD